MSAEPAVTGDSTLLSTRWRFRAALVLAMAADALQIFVLPLFAEGAFSPAEDVLDVAVAAALIQLVGWHWEFLPAFAAELVPGVDLFRSGRWRSPASIVSGNRSTSPQRKQRANARCWRARSSAIGES